MVCQLKVLLGDSHPYVMFVNCIGMTQVQLSPPCCLCRTSTVIKTPHANERYDKCVDDKNEISEIIDADISQ